LFQPKKNNNSRVLNVDINLIKSATKGSWTSEALKKRFQKISKLVGFKVSTHDFRQTFGTNAALEEFTMVQIRDEFGHKSIKSTEKYVAYATQWKDDLRKAAFNPYTFNEGRAYYKECLVLRKKKRELENKLKNLQNNT
jgi:integrase